MTTFKMPALCLVCEKRCDGQFYCSDKCLTKDKNRIVSETRERDRKTLDEFFSKIK